MNAGWVLSPGRRVASSVYAGWLRLTGTSGITAVFDAAYYLHNNPDVVKSGIDPLAHYMRFGARELRRPHRFFDPAFYLSRAEAPEARANPLVHYLCFGWLRNLSPHPLFDPAWYVKEYGASGEPPLLHYARRCPNHSGLSTRPPLEACDFEASIARLKHAGNPVILSVGHALGGGVASYVRRLEERLQGRAELVNLTSYGDAVVLESANPSHALLLAVDAKNDYAFLVEALRRCGIRRMHIQHTGGHALDLNRLRIDLSIPFDFTIHDYLVICPQVHLTDARGRYCGEPDEAGCNRCLSERPTNPPGDITKWRRDYAWVVREAERIIAPSIDTSRRFARYFPDRPVATASHPEASEASASRRPPVITGNQALRIAILGTLSHHKGLEQVRECADLAKQTGASVQFTLVGAVDPALLPRKEPFAQTGAYQASHLPRLLASLDPHLIWFPAAAPETYSYALSEALQAGLPVVVADLGALPERVAGLDWAWVVPREWDSPRLVGFFAEIREANFRTQVPPLPPIPGPTANGAFYPDAYLEPTCRS